MVVTDTQGLRASPKIVIQVSVCSLALCLRGNGSKKSRLACILCLLLSVWDALFGDYICYANSILLMTEYIEYKFLKKMYLLK